MMSQNVTSNLVTMMPAVSHGAEAGGCPPVGIQLEGLILPPVLIVDVILGLLGNVVALWIFCFKLKSWNPNNLFLFNLVIADFLALVSLPLRIDALLRRQWLFGDAMCRINLFLMFSNRSASIALMTVVAFYRYFKVRKHIFVHVLTRNILQSRSSLAPYNNPKNLRLYVSFAPKFPAVFCRAMTRSRTAFVNAL